MTVLRLPTKWNVLQKITDQWVRPTASGEQMIAVSYRGWVTQQMKLYIENWNMKNTTY